VTDRPLFLLTNDDGYQAPGLRALHAALSPFGDVIVVAPETEQSATSHTLSLHRPLRLRSVEPGIFALDGTPADCVYVALHAEKRALPRRPDLVVSGMNHGVNLGADVFYSGTVGGAREGALRGIPALAASADVQSDRTAAASLCARMSVTLLDHVRQRASGGEITPVLMNFNVPSGAGPWKINTTVLGSRLYAEQVVFAKDPRGREYLWIGGAAPSHAVVPGSDTAAFDRGEASLTPLVLDLTAAHDADFARALVTSVAT
jgi:5'-nucleotidase